ncbi:MAG: HTTM domain-containing protein [Steroidobacteraceae bacterium]
MPSKTADRGRARGPSPPAVGPALTTAFTVSWAVAILFDKAYYHHWAWSPTNFGLAAACGLMLVTPRSSRALLVLATAQIADWFSDQSILGNHPIILAMANATLLLAAARRGWSSTWQDDDAGAVLTSAAPAIRLGVLIVYAWATIHKLNTDFLSLDHSCVTFLVTDLRNRPLPMAFLPVESSWLQAGIHGTLVVESLIPLLLAFRKTRGAGVLLGVCFHSFLSSGPRNGFFAFAVVIFPLLWLFASEQAMTRLGAVFRRVVGTRIDVSPATFVRGAALLGIALASLASAHLEINRTYPAWITYNAIVLVWAVSEAWSGVRAVGDCRQGLLRCGDPVLVVMPLLFVFNGACPYLGLKTETSFSMYSNLRTEGGLSNHLFLTADIAPFGFQKDLVEIIDSSDPGLREVARSGKALPWFELRRRAWIDPSMSVTFVRRGEMFVVESIRDSPDIVPPESWWLWRLMPFRTVERNGPRRCDH